MRALVSFVVVALLLAAGAYGYDRLVTEPLRQQLRASLVDRKILDQVLREVREGRATPQTPVPVTVNLQGRPQEVRVWVEQPKVPEPKPGEKPAAPLPPRVVVEAPPVYCRTKEECDRLYAAAPQAIRVSAQVRTGTLAWVCLEPLDPTGKCPQGKEASLPLARPIAFALDVVQSDRGVFHGLVVEGAPVTITNVRTETQVDLKVDAPPLPYNLAAFVRGSTGGSVAAGLRYTNRIWSGFYEIEPTLRYDWRLPPGERFARELSFAFVFPVR